jgi:hypothetical protein
MHLPPRLPEMPTNSCTIWPGSRSRPVRRLTLTRSPAVNVSPAAEFNGARQPYQESPFRTRLHASSARHLYPRNALWRPSPDTGGATAPPRDLGMLRVKPLIALRRPAGETARAIAERQPHLVRKISAQEVDEIGAVGAAAGLRFVFVASGIAEQEIAGLVAQHLVPDLPVQILVGRRIEQLLDPCREQRFVRASPAV